MTDNGHDNDFFVAGGTLGPNARSYIKRPADDELLKHVKHGDFCYVLTPRQMGKSSLMVRTAHRLENEAIKTVIIDVSGGGIKGVEAEAWYFALLKRIHTQLNLTVELGQWWKENNILDPVSRFKDFLREVALTEVEDSIVIFVDEIDSTLSLGFNRDDFFATIRSLYNARATDPVFNRLTFVLLGVATPSDLIEDANRTPFNIGEAIALSEFSREDALPLQTQLENTYPQQAAAILDRIFYWTDGHPYLTQELCMAVVDDSLVTWDDADIDQLVKHMFLDPEAAKKESNLQFVQQRIAGSATKRKTLQLYRQICMGKQMVKDDARDLAQNELKLSGLVCIKDNIVQPANQIYQSVFGYKWIDQNMPPLIQLDRGVRLSLALALIVILPLTGSLVYERYISDTIKGYRESALNKQGLGRYEQAIAEHTKAIELAPGMANSFVLRGRVFIKSGQYYKAINDFSQAIALESSEAIFYSERSNAFYSIDDFDKALEDIVTAIKLEPNQIDYYERKVYIDYKLGTINHSIAKYTVLIKRYPTSTFLYMQRGYAYSIVNDFEHAISDYTKVVELEAENFDAYFKRGIVFFTKLANVELAIADFRKITELEPKNAKDYEIRGYVNFYYLDNNTQALVDFNQLIKLVPSSSRYHFFRGQVHLVLKNFQQALADYSEAVRREPNFSGHYWGRGRAYYGMGNLEKAVIDFSKAIELKPDDPDYYDIRAKVYIDAQKYEKAIADYTQAIELDPKADYYQRRGSAYLESGDNEKATADHLQYLKLASDEVADRV